MTGQHDDRRLEAALAQQLHRFATVHVGQADIHDQQIDLSVARRRDALARARLFEYRELLVESQLLDKCLAQVRIVIDKQYGAGSHERPFPGFGTFQ